MKETNVEDIAISVAITKKTVDDAIKIVEERFEKKLVEVEEIRSPRGRRGFDGQQGPIGPIGPKGEDGLDGEQGIRGATGTTGEKGEDGKDGINGEKGEKGDKGDTGTNGQDGKDGLDGKQGKKGEKGDKGKPGTVGKQGKTGKPGAKGKDGAPGKAGSNGKDGKQGLQGTPGKAGAPGEKGDKGEQGLPGTDAPLPDLKPHKIELEDRFTKLSKNFEQRFNTFTTQARTAAYSMTGGGSVKILDNDDVLYNNPSQLANNDILVWDASISKFRKLNIVTLLNDLGLVGGAAVEYDKLIDDTTTPGLVYIGERVPSQLASANTASTVWRIKRVNENVAPIEVLYADGETTFDKIYDDRTTYAYTVI